MSRVAKNPVKVPAGVSVDLNADELLIKGPKGQIRQPIHPNVKVELTEEDKQKILVFSPASTENKQDNAKAGTMRALANNNVTGVSKGFELQLELVGVGFRAQLQGKELVLSLGFSHPVKVTLPEDITATVPSNTIVVLSSADKQVLGQFAADIRKFRTPEPYKGKGIKFVGETIRRKEAKKK